jgi:hypothetical protein
VHKIGIIIITTMEAKELKELRAEPMASLC